MAKNLKELDMLDGIELTTVEKFKLQGIFPSHLNKYAESIKAIQSRKEKEQNKEGAVLMTQGFINEEEALRELKEKTSKLLVETKS